MGYSRVSSSSTLIARLQGWMGDFASDPGRSRDDIHIDKLDERFQSDSTWVEGAQVTLAAARRVADSRSLPVTLAVEIFLAEGTLPLRSDFRVVHELLSLGLSWTPPSLVAYKPGEEPWVADASFHRVDASVESDWGSGAHAYFQEWYDTAESSYDRRLWIVI
jgi:hypothetical protein